jgi:threonine dehydrogenase-like Zn-dependent dehydrogenase
MSFLLPRDHQRRDIEAVLSLLARGRIDLSALVTDLRQPAAAQAVYDELREAPSERLTSVFAWAG